jgi:hypothetical protein
MPKEIDFVSEILRQTAPRPGAVSGANMSDDLVVGYGDEYIAGDDDVLGDDVIGNLVAVGQLTEVGANALRSRRNRTQRARVAQPGQPRQVGSGLPSPPFAMSSRSTERRAPLGFTEDGTGRNFFTLAAAIGSITTMRAKVSRVAHVDRLVIVPSLAGVVIESIKVGDEEQALASGVPAELYGISALTDTVPDNFSPIGPGLDFIITLRNTTATLITGTIGTKAAVKR